MTTDNRPIQKGDLVIMVRGCNPELLGSIFTVAEVEYASVRNCLFCGNDHTGLVARATHVYRRMPDFDCNRAPVAWLKRIDPDVLQGELPIKEELHA